MFYLLVEPPFSCYTGDFDPAVISPGELAVCSGEGRTERMAGLRVFLYLLAGLVWSTQSAHAYLDPGTGSMMLQLLVAGLAGLAVALKLQWKRFRGLFRRKQDKLGDTQDRSS